MKCQSNCVQLLIRHVVLCMRVKRVITSVVLVQWCVEYCE